jgi:hypothetical protein
MIQETSANGRRLTTELGVAQPNPARSYLYFAKITVAQNILIAFPSA